MAGLTLRRFPEFDKCPRCQAVPEDSTRTVFRCPQCSNFCCSRCSKGDGNLSTWGSNARGYVPLQYCPDCSPRVVLGDHCKVGVVLSEMSRQREQAEREQARLEKEREEEERRAWEALPWKEQERILEEREREERERQEREEREQEIRKIVVYEDGSAGLRREHLYLLPEVASRRGAEVSHLRLEGAADSDLKVLEDCSAQFHRLHTLVLEYCQDITEEGLQSLARLTTLKEVILKGDTPHLTQGGIKALCKSLRGCQVTGGPKPWWRFW